MADSARTESTRARINAVDDDGKPINNLPLGRTPGGDPVDRSDEWNYLVTFLHADGTEKDEGSRDATTPRTIMVVSGPKGVGKTTITLQGARKKLDEGAVYKAIIWFDKRRFLELMHSDPDILEGGYSRADAEQTASAFRRHLDEHDDDRAGLIHTLASYTHSQSEARPAPSLPIIRRFFRDVQPYLLIIDDIDEDFEEQTRDICGELERIRLPNKAILTSRVAAVDLPFESVHITDLKLGLLNKEEAAEVVRRGCSGYGLALQYWTARNREQTQQWLWEFTGGLPDLIVKTMENAERHSQRLNTTTYWLEFFRSYACDYLTGNSTASVADIFAALNAPEKYLLVAMTGATPLAPQSRGDLLTAIGIYPDHPDAESYSGAITSLYARRFLGYKVRVNRSESGSHSTFDFDQEWQLHPFMRGLIETNLETYRNGDYRRVGADLWLEFFTHYANSDPNRVDLLHYLDQGLTSLAWLVEQEAWAKAITLGKTIVNVLLNQQRAGHADRETRHKVSTAPQLIEACRHVITAAERSGSVNENAAYRLLLLRHIAYDEYPNITHEQIAGLLQLRDKFETLESNLRGSVAAYYANIAIMNDDMAEAREWLGRTEGIGAHDDILRARLMLADYLLHAGQLGEALQEVDNVQRAGRSSKPATNEVAIMAHQLLAQLLYMQNDLVGCRDAYIEAARLAKDGNFSDLANDYLKAVTLIDWKLSNNPLDTIGLAIDSLQLASLTTVFECSACKHKITSRELWLKHTVSCANCPAIFHHRCISELGLSQCPLCEAPLPVVSPVQG